MAGRNIGKTYIINKCALNRLILCCCSSSCCGVTTYNLFLIHHRKHLRIRRATFISWPFLFRFIGYNVILHCALHSAERHKVAGSSLWTALANQINFLYKKYKEQNYNTKTQYAKTTKQLSQGRLLVKEIRAMQLVAVKRGENIAVHGLSQ